MQADLQHEADQARAPEDLVGRVVHGARKPEANRRGRVHSDHDYQMLDSYQAERPHSNRTAEVR